MRWPLDTVICYWLLVIGYWLFNNPITSNPITLYI